MVNGHFAHAHATNNKIWTTFENYSKKTDNDVEKKNNP